MKLVESTVRITSKRLLAVVEMFFLHMKLSISLILNFAKIVLLAVFALESNPQGLATQFTDFYVLDSHIFHESLERET